MSGVIAKVLRGVNRFRMHQRTVMELWRKQGYKKMGHSETTDFCKLQGNVKVEIFDKLGELKFAHEGHNDIVDVGKNHLLDVGFHAVSATSTWYFGIVDNSGFTAFAAADTMGSHSGWNEFTTYSESTRVAWAENAAASKSITNTTVSTFNITGTATLKGIFVVSESTKSGTSGTLWSTAAFAATVAVVSSDQLKITYTINT